jgi:transcriptional regulator with XRE-family HTH domain
MVNLGFIRHNISVVEKWEDLSEEDVLREVGSRVTAFRLDLNMTQAALARKAGISKRTLERLEAGHGSALMAFLGVCRALGILDRMEVLLPTPTISPMALLKLRGQQRQRAASPTREQTRKARVLESLGKTAGLDSEMRADSGTLFDIETNTDGEAEKKAEETSEIGGTKNKAPTRTTVNKNSESTTPKPEKGEYVIAREEREKQRQKEILMVREPAPKKWTWGE